MCWVGYFFLCFVDDVELFFFIVFGMLVGEIEYVVFDEDEVGDVFEYLCVGIGFDVLFVYCGFYLFDGCFVVVGL